MEFKREYSVDIHIQAWSPTSAVSNRLGVNAELQART